MKVRFTPMGRAQFLAALDYIRADNPRRRWPCASKAAAVSLPTGRLSRLWDSLPEFPELPFRETIVAPYRFFYRVKTDTVWIVAVWHGAQLPDEPDDLERG